MMHKHLSAFISFSVLLGIISVLAFVSAYPTEPRDGQFEQYVVIFKPDTDFFSAYNKVIQSGGRPIKSGTFDFIIIAGSNTSHFRQSVKKNGAILVLSPIIRGGCFIENKAAFKKE